MKFLPAIVVLIGLVMLMAGAGRRGLRAGEQIAAVILGFLVLALVFGWLVRRTI